MAILMRSVRKDAAPLMHALREHDIPFIVRGVQQLFEQPEIEAARCIFQYINGDLSRTLLRDLWLDADLGVSEDDVNRAINALPDLFDEDEKWLLKGLQEVYLNFLKTMGLVEDNIPDPSEVGTGAYIYYNLGMFSEVIADFEAIHYASEPKSKYGTSSTGWKTTPWTTTTKVTRGQFPQPQRRGHHRPPVRLAVAGRLHPSPAANCFLLRTRWARYLIPELRWKTKPGTSPTWKMNVVCSTLPHPSQEVPLLLTAPGEGGNHQNPSQFLGEINLLSQVCQEELH